MLSNTDDRIFLKIKMRLPSAFQGNNIQGVCTGFLNGHYKHIQNLTNN
jgi:hypothetical protein